MELRKGVHQHKDAIRLNTARNSFEYVLRARQYTKVYIPYYTCEVMLEPINKLGIEVDHLMSFVSVDFYLHETQTSNLMSGKKPNYNFVGGLEVK